MSGRQITSTLARAEGVDALPRTFLEWSPNRWADRAEIMHGLCGILCTTSGQKLWQGQVRSPSYDVIRSTDSDRLFQEIAFSATRLAAILRNGDIMHDLDHQMTT